MVFAPYVFFPICTWYLVMGGDCDASMKKIVAFRRRRDDARGGRGMCDEGAGLRYLWIYLFLSPQRAQGCKEL
jgi:hypothetical protein